MERFAPERFIAASKGLSRQASRITRPRPEAPSTARETRSSETVSNSTSRSLCSRVSTGIRKFLLSTSMPCPAS